MANDPVLDFFNSGANQAIEGKNIVQNSGDQVYDFLNSGKIPEAPIAKSEPVQSGYALPDTTLGRFAAGALGEAKGASDFLITGPAQFLTHAAADIYPSNFPGANALEGAKQFVEEKKKSLNEGFENLTRNTRSSADIGEGFGNIIGGLALPQSKAAEGANLFNRMIAAAKTGAIAGTAAPTDDEKNFWLDKAKQIGGGALTGFLAQPVIEGATKAVGKAGELLAGWGKSFIDAIRGKGSPEIVNSANNIAKNASPELQQAIQEAASGGKEIDHVALGRQLEADSLPYKVQLTAGQARQDPIAISQEMNTRSKNPAMIYRLQDQNNALIQNLNHVRDIGAPDAAVADHITAGEKLINAGQKIIDDKQAQTSALYKKLIDANGGDLPMDGKAFVDNAEALLKKQMKSPFLPTQIRSVMEDIKSGEPMTFENFENLRTTLATAARTAERAGDGNAAHAIGLVRNSLENMPINSEVQGIKEMADAARASAKEGFDMLRENPALKAIYDGKAQDNNFIQKYIVGSAKKDIANLAEVFKEDPEALQTVKAGTINYLKNAAGVLSDNGNFSQHGYNKALQSLGPKLDVIFGPDEAQIIRTVGNVSKYIQLAPKGAFINASNTDVANLARGGADVATHAIDRATGLPIGSITRGAVENIMQKRANQTAIKQMLGPGAGAIGEAIQSQTPAKIAQGAKGPLSALVARQLGRKLESGEE